MNTKIHTVEGGSPQGPTSYSRRDAITSIAALSLAAAAVASDAIRTMQSPETAEDLGPDFELITLGEAMQQSWAAEIAHEAATKADYSEQACDEREAIYAITSGIVDRIYALDATTLAGLIVKARAISWCHCGDPITRQSFSGFDGETSDLKLAASLTCDLLRIAEVRNV